MALYDRLLALAQGVAADVKTLAGRIKGFAPTENPTFTGTVKVPTPGAAENSSVAPSTEWVLARMAEQSPGRSNLFQEKIQNLGNVSGAVMLTPANGGYIKLTVAGTTTLSATFNLTAGYQTAFTVEVTNGAAFSLSWPAGIKWDGGVIPSLTVAGVDRVVLSYDGTTLRGSLVSKDSK